MEKAERQGRGKWLTAVLLAFFAVGLFLFTLSGQLKL
jgi:hypothetical protein